MGLNKKATYRDMLSHNLIQPEQLADMCEQLEIEVQNHEDTLEQIGKALFPEASDDIRRAEMDFGAGGAIDAIKNLMRRCTEERDLRVSDLHDFNKTVTTWTCRALRAEGELQAYKKYADNWREFFEENE